MRVKCLDQEHTALPWPGLVLGRLDPGSIALTVRPLRLPHYTLGLLVNMFLYIFVLFTSHIVFVFFFVKRISAVNNAEWLDSLTEPPLLQYSPAAQFLASYFPDGVGLSPTLNDWKSKSEDSTGARFCFVCFT